jgi:hypothetical protein
MADDHLTDFERFGRITASVVADILRHGDHSRKWAWRVITGREPMSTNWDMQRGLDHEEDAIAAAESQLASLASPGRFVVHPHLSWLGASPDGFIEIDGREYPIEAKCPRELHVEVPQKYYDQIQTQLECCDAPYGYFVSWTEGGVWMKKVERDHEWWTLNKPELESFYLQYVVTDIEPPKSPRRKKEV